ncbi:hypothetical protein [Mastigocladopsis repens]|uniref:hypothetical protein n=1 Tax=Mastigocladopsis repens TaxID=221287 RepID=UPI0012EA44F6|nr:hypothetical protein [Mastigocladopsis repens]
MADATPYGVSPEDRLRQHLVCALRLRVSPPQRLRQRQLPDATCFMPGELFSSHQRRKTPMADATPYGYRVCLQSNAKQATSVFQPRRHHQIV